MGKDSSLLLRPCAVSCLPKCPGYSGHWSLGVQSSARLLLLGIPLWVLMASWAMV